MKNSSGEKSSTQMQVFILEGLDNVALLDISWNSFDKERGLSIFEYVVNTIRDSYPNAKEKLVLLDRFYIRNRYDLKTCIPPFVYVDTKGIIWKGYSTILSYFPEIETRIAEAHALEFLLNSSKD